MEAAIGKREEVARSAKLQPAKRPLSAYVRAQRTTKKLRHTLERGKTEVNHSSDELPPLVVLPSDQAAVHDGEKANESIVEATARRHGPMVEVFVRKMVMTRIQELERDRAQVCQQYSTLAGVVRALQERQLELKCELNEAYTTAKLLLADDAVLQGDEDFNSSAEGAFLCILGAQMAVSSECLRGMMPFIADE